MTASVSRAVVLYERPPRLSLAWEPGPDPQEAAELARQMVEGGGAELLPYALRAGVDVGQVAATGTRQ